MKSIIDYYDELAPLYDEDRFGNTYGAFIDQQEKLILSRLSISKTSDEFTIDVACGTGRFADYAQVSYDASSFMIEEASRKFPDKTFIQTDADSLPLEDSSVDNVLCFHLFMHLDKARAKSIFVEIHRVLKPKGKFIFDVPSHKRRRLLGNEKRDSWHGATSYSVEELAASFPKFTIKNTYGILFLPVHRVPVRLRFLFKSIDRLLADSFLKKYSSYLVICMEKDDLI